MFSCWHFSVWSLLTSSKKKIAWILKACVTTPEPASHRRDCETQGDKREPIPEPAETDAGDTTPVPMSQHLASDRRDWETSDKREHLASSVAASSIRPQRLMRLGDTGRQAGPASEHLASDRRDWETQGDKRETQPRRRHSIWPLTAETGRHRETSGRHEPGAMSQHRRDCETQGDKPRSQRHSIWHRRRETRLRDKGTSGRQDPRAGVTASGSRETSRKHERHRETSGRHTASQHLGASVTAWQHPTAETGRRDWETQGDKCETRSRCRRHSIWHLISGETTPEPASQHLASDRRNEQGDKWETRFRSHQGVTASGL